jgi:hypothetical protein
MCVIVQKRNRIVNALTSPDIRFTIIATFSLFPKAKSEKNLPAIWNKGAPGGCPT